MSLIPAAVYRLIESGTHNGYCSNFYTIEKQIFGETFIPRCLLCLCKNIIWIASILFREKILTKLDVGDFSLFHSVIAGFYDAYVTGCAIFRAL